MLDPRTDPNPASPFLRPHRSWPKKFGDALRGVFLGARREASFHIHAISAVLVIAIAAVLQMTLVEWGLLVLCITVVCAAELFNSAIEELAQAVDANVNPHIRDALDIASGAVLLTALGAAAVGGSLFLARLLYGG